MQAGSVLPAKSYFDLLPRDLKTVIMAYILGSSKYYERLQQHIRVDPRCMYCLEKKLYSIEKAFDDDGFGCTTTWCFECGYRYTSAIHLPICSICSTYYRNMYWGETCAWCRDTIEYI